MSEIVFDKIKGYKYQTPFNRYRHTECPDVECNEYLSIKDGVLVIGKGYCWNGSSGPAIDTAKCMTASLVHDAYYQMFREECLDRDIWRLYADKQYHKYCIEDGMWKWLANLRYKVIRKCGEKYTHQTKRQRKRRVTIINGRIVKSFLILLAVICCLSVAGCMFVHVPGKGTVVSLFKNIDADEIYIEKDPNGAIWIVKYDSDTKNARLKVNPITKTLEAVVENGE